MTTVTSSVSDPVWTPEAISRFWTFCASKPDADLDYFANQFGEAVVSFLSFVVPLAGARVLDYGCGPGFLVPHLLARGAEVSAADFSDGSVALANERFGGNHGWRGARLTDGGDLTWLDDSFDVFCCLETIEHALDDDLDTLFRESWRMLRPGGIALFTTPNEEPLHRSMVLCPRCDCVFHEWQHLRAWSAPILRKRLEAEGYEVAFCRGVEFGSFRPTPPLSWKDISPRNCVAQVRRARQRLLDTLVPRAFPHGRLFRGIVSSHGNRHLVAVARKMNR